jgi:plastocyanin
MPSIIMRQFALLLLAVLVGHLPAAEREFTLEARMTGYIGASGPIAGERNPTLSVGKGDSVKIILINAEPMAHDICLDAHKIKSAQTLKAGEKIEVSFIAEQSDAYYCSVPGHRQVGMVGQLVVGSPDGSKDATSEVISTDSAAR